MHPVKGMSSRILLKNCRSVEGSRNIIIENDKIIEVFPSENSKKFKENFDNVINLKNKLIIPGMIDVHVHVRDMKMAYKETWETSSLAALAGGVTSIIDMPNTLPPTTDLKGLIKKREAAQKAKVNYKFHLGATEDNLKDLEEILTNDDSDIAGIKVFLAGSSSNDTITNVVKLKEIFQLAKEYNKVLLIHTEMQNCVDKWQNKIINKCIQNHDIIRNRECAIKGTELVLKLADEIGNRIYICHVSTKEEIELIRRYKSKNIFCEVTPHHLVLARDILDLVGNFGKVNPPLRTKEDIRVLWDAIVDGTIDCIGSDHAPHTLDEKLIEYSKAVSGFPGLETSIPILITNFHERNISIKKMIELTCKNPAEIFKFMNRGSIKEGYFADLAIIDTENEFSVISALFQTKAKYSPFDRTVVKARVEMVFVNGRIYEIGKSKMTAN